MAAPAVIGADQIAAPPSEVGIAIVGGGLGGLALAVGLLERGFDVHVFEAAQELRTGSGTIVGLAANGGQQSVSCAEACFIGHNRQLPFKKSGR